MSRPTAVKGLVGVGLAASLAAAVAIPVQAEPGSVELSGQTSAAMVRDRGAAATGTTSRGSGRTAVGTAGASVTSPAAAESVKVSAGPSGVTAVAKPKPKPKVKPKPEAKTEAKPVEAAKAPVKAKAKPTADRSSRSSSRSSVPSGTGSGAYVGWCGAKGLGSNASVVCSAVRSHFGITSIGGFRAGAGDHGTGKAVDVMVSGSTGDAVAQWAINHMGQLNITYVIWKQRIWLSGASSWRSMEDRGSVTANHYDHVHISVE
ncbi:hypothetical protein ASG74_04100 [Knoellia sp. Soil729]|nr:hypothetical protein ASG74_04100 [Knoellia sp. Soil729]